MMVGIRDRRELPFFQVRVHAVQAVRAETAGPRRLRAIGFYALLCQLANEQRHTGEHRVVRVTYDTLAARGQMSKRSVKLLLDALQAAQVVRYERLSDRATGAVVSLLHLLILDEPWIGLTVAMADHLATPREGGHLLRDLGLVVVLLEFCAEQRAEHGGLAAEVTRGDIAERSGLTVDRVDDCNHALEQRRRACRSSAGGRQRRPPPAEPLHDPRGTVHRRPGRHLDTSNPAERYCQGGATSTSRAAEWYLRNRRTVLAGRRTGTRRAAKFRHPGHRRAALYHARGKRCRRKASRKHPSRNNPPIERRTPEKGEGEPSRRSRSCARPFSPRGRQHSARALAVTTRPTARAGWPQPARCSSTTPPSGSPMRSTTWSPTRSSARRR